MAVLQQIVDYHNKTVKPKIKELLDKVNNIQLTPGPQGSPGKDGADGKDGAAATITIGTVTTGDAGTSASVKNVGTSTAAKLDFTIPRGAKGDKGDTGAKGDTGPQGAGNSVSVTMNTWAYRRARAVMYSRT